MTPDLVTTILVPQGAEYQAVCRGLQNVSAAPTVVPIPMGVAAINAFEWQHQDFSQIGASILVMGLCGSLRSDYRVGDAVLYRACYIAEHHALNCDPQLTDRIAARFSAQIPRVQALTSRQFISTAAEKQQLATTHGMDVVDMEGAAILSALAARKAKVAMLRVVSDGSESDMPNLTKAIRASGRLSPSHLMLEMAQQPVASWQFIRGSLHGLRQLRQITAELFN